MLYGVTEKKKRGGKKEKAGLLLPCSWRSPAVLSTHGISTASALPAQGSRQSSATGRLLAQSCLCCMRCPKEKGTLCTAQHGTVLPSHPSQLEHKALFPVPTTSPPQSHPVVSPHPVPYLLSPSCPLPPSLTGNDLPLSSRESAAGWAAWLERKPNV